MMARKIVAGLFCSTLVAGALFFCFSEKQALLISKENDNKQQTTSQSTPIKQEAKKTYDLYANTPYDLPLLAIYEISKVPESIKKIIDNVLESSQGFYMLKKAEDKILILLQNPILESNTYNRHNLQYLELYLDGRQEFHNAGYNGVEGEIFENFDQGKDSWTFDKTVEYARPLKHIAKDDKGKIKFTEIWSYDEKNPIKYLMKDSKGKTISVLKETLENESNLRKEHIFYDNDGNTIISVTINYDGANISRFTYYNSHQTIDSISLISEYVDGLKIKEQVYDEKYQLIKTLNATYTNDTRTGLQILDSENNEIAKLNS